MKKLFLLLFLFIAFAARAQATDIDLGASTSVPGFNTANAGADTPLTGVSVTLGSASVTCSNCLPTGAVGVGGMKILLGSVVYDIASVASRSAFTLTTTYGESTGTVTGTLYKFVHLRIYATSAFIPSGSSVVVQPGAPGTAAWYRRYGASIVNDGSQNILYIPAVDNLPATTNSNVPTARYFAALYTQSGGFIQNYPGCVTEFRLDHTTTPTSWAQICVYNLPPNPGPLFPTNYYTAAQIDSRFPSCVADSLDYYAATGNVKSCLGLSAEFQITGGILSLAGPSGYNRIQEEGSNLPQRLVLNIVGTTLTAADDVPNFRTNITSDADVDALASTSTTGLYNRTGSGTSNTINTSAGLAGVISDETGSGALVFGTSPTIGTPAITGGTHTAITGLGIRSTGSGAFDLQFLNTENLTANRALTLTLGNAARTLSLGGNLTTGGTFSTTGTFSSGGNFSTGSTFTTTGTFSSGGNFSTGAAFTTTPANALTLTTTGSTNVTLPTTGTLASINATDGRIPYRSASGAFSDSPLFREDANTVSQRNSTTTQVSRFYHSFTDASNNQGAEIRHTATGTELRAITAGSGADNLDVSLTAAGTGRVVIKGYPYTLQVDTSTVGNVGTGQDNLHSYTVAANSLTSNGDYIEGDASGNFTANDNNKGIELRVGGTAFFNMGTQDIDGAVGWSISYRVVRTSSTAILVSADLTINIVGVSGADAVTSFTNGYFSQSSNGTAAVSDLAANTLTILVQGEGTSNNDITQNLTIIKLVQR